MAHRALMRLHKNLPNRVTQNKPLKNFLLLDFEATCIKGEILKPQEIIEFPCIVISSEDWQVKDVFHQYVRPKINPQLSLFCVELTGIMQETVQDEQYFPAVFAKFCQWLKEGKYFDEKDKSAFVTCGDWDLKVMLLNQCKLDNIDVPSGFQEWINLKKAFYSITKYYPRGLADMLKYLEMEFEGKPHSGIDDVHNMMRIIQKLVDKYNKAQFSVTSRMEETTKIT